MTATQSDFFRFLENIAQKIADINGIYYGYENDHIQNEMDYFSFLEEQLKNEIRKLQKQFHLSDRGILVMVAFVMIYFQYDAVKKYLLMSKDIVRFFTRFYGPMLILDLRDALYELEDKFIIEIKKIEFYPVRVFWDSDQECNDYYLIPVKPNFVPFFR